MSLILSKDQYLGKSPLSVLRRSPQEPFNRHTHQFGELVIILSGRALHSFNGKEFPIGQGDVFVVKKGDEHEFVNLDRLFLINVLYDPDIINPLFETEDDLPGFRALFLLEPELRQKSSRESLLHLSPDELSHLELIVRRLENELDEKRAGYAKMAIAHFLEAAVFLSRCYSDLAVPNAREILRLARVLGRIESAWDEDLRVEELAKLASMSLRTFQRTFASVMGTSPHDYHLSLRLRRACSLLEEGKLSVTEVAYACGFNDSNYFSRIFGKKIGLTPSRYREQRRPPAP